MYRQEAGNIIAKFATFNQCLGNHTKGEKLGSKLENSELLKRSIQTQDALGEFRGAQHKNKGH